MNPLATLVLPEPTSGRVYPFVGELMRQGVAVHIYPLEVRLVAAPTVAHKFTFTFAGPPGSYRVQATSDFSTWTDLEVVPQMLDQGFLRTLRLGRGNTASTG